MAEMIVGELLTHPDVSEIQVLGRKVWTKTNAQLALYPKETDPDEVLQLLDTLLRRSGQPPLDPTQPLREFVLDLPPQAQRARFHLVLPPLARELTLTIAKQLLGTITLTGLVNNGTLSGDAADFLGLAIQQGASIMVCGLGGAGKTTLVSALVNEIRDSEHIVCIEEVPELRFALSNVAHLYNRGLPSPNVRIDPAALLGSLLALGQELHKEGSQRLDMSWNDALVWLGAHAPAPLPRFSEPVSLERLVKESMRMRADRIVLGEVRGAEAFDLLIAANSGTPIVGTIHGSSARDGLSKLATLAALQTGLAHATLLIARSVDIVVFLRPPRHDGYGVQEIIEVSSRVVDETTLVTQAIFARNEQGELLRVAQPSRDLALRLSSKNFGKSRTAYV